MNYPSDRGLKLGVDHLRAALESLREIVGISDEDLQPASIDDLLAAVLDKGWTTWFNCSRCRTSSLLAV
jgi:hypothetical protein